MYRTWTLQKCKILPYSSDRSYTHHSSYGYRCTVAFVVYVPSCFTCIEQVRHVREHCIMARPLVLYSSITTILAGNQ